MRYMGRGESWKLHKDRQYLDYQSHRTEIANAFVVYYLFSLHREALKTLENILLSCHEVLVLGFHLGLSVPIPSVS